jgi:hypothetical protein
MPGRAATETREAARIDVAAEIAPANFLGCDASKRLAPGKERRYTPPTDPG